MRTPFKVLLGIVIALIIVTAFSAVTGVGTATPATPTAPIVATATPPYLTCKQLSRFLDGLPYPDQALDEYLKNIPGQFDYVRDCENAGWL